MAHGEGAIALTGAHVKAPEALHPVESRGPQHPPPRARAGQPEDHRAVAIGVVARHGEGEQPQAAVVLLGRDEGAPTQARDALEGQQLVAQVHQHRAAQHPVEGAQLLRGGVVDRAHHPLHARAQRLVSQGEARAARLVGVGGRPAAGRPVQLALVVEVQRDDLGAATLHLEGPEAVPGAHVQRAKAVHALGQAVAVHVAAQVEPALGDQAGGQLHRVVPAPLLDPAAQVVVDGHSWAAAYGGAPASCGARMALRYDHA